MRNRCNNPRATQHSYYGARGIRVCERWNTFAQFLADMGPKPTSAHTLERVDNDGPYSKENCRWATQAEQSRNTRRNHFLTVDGVTRCISEWEEITGIKGPTIRYRIRHGLPPLQPMEKS